MGKKPADRPLDEQKLTGSRPQQHADRDVRKQVLFDLLQAKATLLPSSVGFIAFIYLLLFVPVRSGLWLGLCISIGSILAGVWVFYWRYGVRYQHYYALKSRAILVQLEDQQTQLEEQRLLENGLLQGGLSEVNSFEGLNILRALDREYRLLRHSLTSGKEMDLFSASTLDSMLSETYFRGLSVLKDVLELERAIRSTDCAQLQSETAALSDKVAAIQADPAQQERVVHMQERIASNQERIQIVSQLNQREEELLYQASRCEASLGKTRIELAALKTDASGTDVSTVIEALRKTIDRAREVQEELKQLGY